MQQIITAINAARKKVALPEYLGPGPSGPQYTDPSTGADNLLIQQYNEAITELIAIPSNNITVVPPDFFTYFENNQASTSTTGIPTTPASKAGRSLESGPPSSQDWHKDVSTGHIKSRET